MPELSHSPAFPASTSTASVGSMNLGVDAPRVSSKARSLKARVNLIHRRISVKVANAANGGFLMINGHLRKTVK
jgi:hypothetical protein